MLDRLWDEVSRTLFGAAPPLEALRERALDAAPILWLLGKTGAGKTAIVAGLTGDSRAQIGNGFESCTRHSSIYDAPAETPLLRFLDTRGLEEPGYDPAEDIAWCEARAHCLLVAMKAQDHDQAAILRVVREVRRRHPEWPLVVAQTGLHGLYQRGEKHPPEGAPLPPQVTAALAHQRDQFAKIAGAQPRFVAIDFTEVGDGHEPRLYGAAALDAALAEALPSAIAALVAARSDTGSDAAERLARQSLVAYAALAASAGLVPLPLAGAAGLAGVQAAMLQALARPFGVKWTPALFGQLAAALSAGTLFWFALRYGLAEAAKLVPGLGTFVGGAANAASAAAFTAGVGQAALVILRANKRGQEAAAAEIRSAYADGFRVWRESKGAAA